VGTEHDVTIRRSEPRDDVAPVVAELLHAHVEARLAELIENVLRRFHRAGLRGPPSGKIRIGEKRHMGLDSINTNGADGEERSENADDNYRSAQFHSRIHGLHE
jgi:hypothetical protein